MDNGFTVEKFIATSPEKVFDAWISPDALGIWMVKDEVEKIEATCDPRVGGEFQINMISASRSINHTGTYKTIDRPKLLEFTWISPFTNGIPTLVSITFTAVDGGTRLALTHTMLPDQYRDAHRMGWTSFIESLHDNVVEGKL